MIRTLRLGAAATLAALALTACASLVVLTAVYLVAPVLLQSMSTTHTAPNTLLMLLVLACKAAATVASLLKRGASRMPGVMDSFG